MRTVTYAAAAADPIATFSALMIARSGGAHG